MRGIPTGLQDLDTLTGGWQGADLVIITTPSSVSQMSLALSMALHVATTDQHGVGLFSLEMHKHHIVQRLLAMRTGIDVYRLRTGWITDEERTLVAAAARTLSKAHLWIDDTADLSLVQLRQRAQQLVEIQRVALIMIDNIHLIQLNAHGKRHGNQAQDVGEKSRDLKALAQELNIPVVVGAPIACALANRHSKGSQRSGPQESSPEKTVDHILFLDRDVRSHLATERKRTVTIIAYHGDGLVAHLHNYIQKV
jgi:replicative DNA helicase